MTTHLKWHVARLTPAALEIFTDGFYPDRNKVGNRYVFYALIPSNTQQKLVAIVGHLDRPAYVRTVVAQLAASMLEDVDRSVSYQDKEALAVLELQAEALRFYLQPSLEEAESV